MVANWIEQARQSAIKNARDPERKFLNINMYFRKGKKPRVPYQNRTETFHAESVTPEEVVQFLNSYLAPVLALLNDLRTYSSDHEYLDFLVEEPTDEFLYMGDVADLGGKSFRDQYALTQVDTSYRGATDYPMDENYAFGREYVVGHWTKEYLASVRLFPRTSSNTHYAGVEYQVENHSAVVKAGENPMDVLPGLQAAVASLYAFYVEKQARYFKW